MSSCNMSSPNRLALSQSPLLRNCHQSTGPFKSNSVFHPKAFKWMGPVYQPVLISDYHQETNKQIKQNKSLKEQTSHCIPLLDDFFLSPFAKWSQYHIFPLKFTLHVILVVFITIQMFLLIKQETSHLRQSLMNLYSLFFLQNSSANPWTITHMYNPSSMKQLLTHIIQHYFYLNSHTITKYHLVYGNTLPITILFPNQTIQSLTIHKDVQMDPQVMYLLNSLQTIYNMKIHIVLREIYNGPFWMSYFLFDSQLIFDASEKSSIKVSMTWNIFDCNLHGHYKSVYLILFHLISLILCIVTCCLLGQSIVHSYMVYNRVKKKIVNQCTHIKHTQTTQTYHPLCYPSSQLLHSSNITTPLLSSTQPITGSFPDTQLCGIDDDDVDYITQRTYLKNYNSEQPSYNQFLKYDKLSQPSTCRGPDKRSLELKNFQDMTMYHRNLNQDNQHQDYNEHRHTSQHQFMVSTWKSLTFYDIIQFYSIWDMMCFIAHLIHITIVIYCYMSYKINVEKRLQYTGMSCSLTWICLLRYLDYDPNYSILRRTMQKGLPKIIEFLLSIIPLFFGFCILGISLFWTVTDFASLSASSQTLFAILNGDELHHIFKKIYRISPCLSSFYFYVFSCIFMYVILNMVISIIDESFFSQKHCHGSQQFNPSYTLSSHQGIPDYVKSLNIQQMMTQYPLLLTQEHKQSSLRTVKESQLFYPTHFNMTTKRYFNELKRQQSIRDTMHHLKTTKRHTVVESNHSWDKTTLFILSSRPFHYHPAILRHIYYYIPQYNTRFNRLHTDVHDAKMNMKSKRFHNLNDGHSIFKHLKQQRLIHFMSIIKKKAMFIHIKHQRNQQIFYSILFHLINQHRKQPSQHVRTRSKRRTRLNTHNQNLCQYSNMNLGHEEIINNIYPSVTESNHTEKHYMCTTPLSESVPVHDDLRSVEQSRHYQQFSTPHYGYNTKISQLIQYASRSTCKEHQL